MKDNKKIRRKRLFWNTIDPSNLINSIWHEMTRGAFRVSMDDFEYNEKEFLSLFTALKSDSPRKNSKNSECKDGKKRTQQVIDRKRVMNGGIVLARLKLSFEDMKAQISAL